MLKKLTIRAFQRHKKRTVVFDPHVTTIIGPSDAGKSSIMRALLWLALNRPPRGTFIRGKGPARVTLQLGKHTISRVQGKGINLYILNGKKYKAFGKGKVPEDIAKVLNLSPANFQRQADLHFWFSDTPGQVSKNLNHIINLGVIDNTLAKAAAEVRKTQTAIKINAERLKAAIEKKKELSWVPAFCDAADAVQMAMEKRDRLGLQASQLRNLVQGAQRAAQTQDSAAQAYQCGRAALRQGQQATRTAALCGSLRKLLARIVAAKAAAATPAPDITPVLRVREWADGVANGRRALQSFIEEIELQRRTLCQTRSTLESRNRLLRQRLKGRCPACGQLIKSRR